MSDWVSLTPSVLAAGGAILFVLLLLALLMVRRSQRRHSDMLRQQIRHLDKELQKANKQALEVRSVMVGLGQQVSEQQDIILHLSERLKELENADTDGRMYSRASKMVKLGADINELIEECELPKAEAELMLSLQKKMSGREAIPPLSSDPEQRSSAGNQQRSARKPVRRN
ncbi:MULTISPECIES: DUF2802 domain-containing protein [Vibrio]|uniref:DUF2802 domain-containing protein n=1 Tax=Vibrio ostreae TaxID=2841925 RepID=A0A975UAD8_9VIBR|nr:MULTISPECIES: DUF2802 domain-containing protein [Vibrio]QXO18163.1 DUF2802 domain-containing protein [Vibrio ostreae]